jgi:hypothetical protein
LLILALLLTPAPFLQGFDGEISKRELGFGFHPEYNRSMHFSWDFSAFGLVEFRRMLSFGAGLAAGQSWDIAEVDAYLFAEIASPFFRDYVPLSIKAAYIYNGLPGYETHIHTLLPLASLSWKWFGAALGGTLRFTRFAGDPVLFEPILAYSFYANFYNAGEAVMGIRLANFDDFSGNNMGSYFFGLYSCLRLTPRAAIAGELKIDMSGNVGRITSVYGISIREGVVFSW